jgi:hypothetical protein
MKKIMTYISEKIMTYIKSISVKDISKILRNILIIKNFSIRILKNVLISIKNFSIKIKNRSIRVLRNILISIKNFSIRILRNIQISIKNFSIKIKNRSIRIFRIIEYYYYDKFVFSTEGGHTLIVLWLTLSRVLTFYNNLDDTYILEYFNLILANFNLIYLEGQLFTDSIFLNINSIGEGPSNNTQLGGNDSVGEGSSSNTPWDKGPTDSRFYDNGKPNLLMNSKGRYDLVLSDREYAIKLQESRELKESMVPHQFVAQIKLESGGADFYYSFKDRHGSRAINFWPEIFHKSKASISYSGAVRTYVEDGITFTYDCRGPYRGEYTCTVSYGNFSKVIDDKIELMRHLSRHQVIYGKVRQS